MNSNAVEFEISVDTRKTPFKQDDVYRDIESCVKEVPGWESSIENGEVKVHPMASFGTEVIAVISLLVSVSGLSYNVVRNFIKDRAEKKSKDSEIKMKKDKLKLQKEEIELLKDLSEKLDKLEKTLSKYGRVKINITK